MGFGMGVERLVKVDGNAVRIVSAPAYADVDPDGSVHAVVHRERRRNTIFANDGFHAAGVTWMPPDANAGLAAQKASPMYSTVQVVM